jgi:hypothetical protein
MNCEGADCGRGLRESTLEAAQSDDSLPRANVRTICKCVA